ncbi:hypothetical protein [Nonomuraea sp. NPDC049129]|uniref:hypothetical protein n=1 Tax=Nonomuraea sp. NPDC049129 TaxID=3155272 RepID=UPI0033F75C79
MKRSSMPRRKTELKQGKPLERKTALRAGGNIERKTPLRARSKKQEAKYRVRRVLVAELLEERPICERCQSARATDVHEPGMRSRGADICDPEQCVCLCRLCHCWIHDNPAAATAEGWLIASWDRKAS